MTKTEKWTAAITTSVVVMVALIVGAAATPDSTAETSSGAAAPSTLPATLPATNPTTPHAITLPSHTSMLTGVIPRKHEIEWNKDLPLSKPVYPKYPTLFAVAHKAGYTTAMIAGKSKFDTLAIPDSLDWQWVPDTEKVEDVDVARHAAAVIR